jgi:uncharacterized repeat protein (TIGR04076 family)
LNAPLAERYCAAQPASRREDFHEGQVFLLNDASRPEGLCDRRVPAAAPGSVCKYIFAFISGGRGFYDSWMKDPNTMVACCNDGLRPVVFLLERVDD